MLGPQYPGVPHDWAWMVASFSKTAAEAGWLRPMADLCGWLAASPYRTAGLCGVKSMHDLIVAPSADVFANPHLVIGYLPDEGLFAIRYEDGSEKPWARAVEPTEIEDVLQRFFERRARWYRPVRVRG